MKAPKREILHHSPDKDPNSRTRAFFFVHPDSGGLKYKHKYIFIDVSVPKYHD